MSADDVPEGKDVNIEIAGISDVSGQANIAGGHVIHAEQGATVIIGAPAAAASGLSVLPELMKRSDDVRMIVADFRTDFRVAHEQVNRLGDYKDLHDQLHKLQFHCYNGVAQAAPRFPDDDLTVDSLTDHALTIETIVEELNDLTLRPSIPRQELSWIEEVRLAKTDLRNAVDALDASCLKKALWRMNRLLSTQPARINALLNHSAHALNLPELLKALTRVSDTLSSLDLDPKKVGTFQSGVVAMGELNRLLTALVDDHDRWQALDVELRRVEASMEHNLFEFEMSWPDIKKSCEPMYLEKADDWASALKKESDALEALIAGNNPAKTRRCFRSYQRRVTDRFYRVDVKLKLLCGEMRQIGSPLAAVLEVLE
jgi:hypothetical protein